MRPPTGSDGAKIAHRRADVAELNARARAVMRATGRLGPDELIAGGAAFAVGDRVLVKRNDNRCAVRNGDRGVVTAIDMKGGTLRVRFGERTAELDSRFLSQPTQSGRPALGDLIDSEQASHINQAAERHSPAIEVSRGGGLSTLRGAGFSSSRD